MSPSVESERRRAQTYPLPHPHGWYQLLDSRELAASQVRQVEAFGETWAVFRGASGQVGVLHGVCPHLGAQLADGSVKGDCLTCPFHGWAFREDGALDHVPALDRAPRVRGRSLPVREHYGLILAWHGPVDADGQPPYEPNVIPELDGPDWRRRGTWDAGELAMHQLEFCENAVDDQHFHLLHGALRVPWTQVRVPGVDIDHVAEWHADPEVPHLSHFHDEAHLVMAGARQSWSRVHGHGTFVGPGSLVLIRVTVPDVGDVMIGHTHTPVQTPGEPLRLRVRFTWWAQRRVPAALAWYIAGSWVAQWRNDVAIWEGKSHLPRPMLCAADGRVRDQRRWFSQFYDEDTARAWLGRRTSTAREVA